MKKLLIIIMFALLSQVSFAFYEYDTPPGHTELKVVTVNDTWDYIPTECRKVRPGLLGPGVGEPATMRWGTSVVILSNGRKLILRHMFSEKIYGEPFKKSDVFYYRSPYWCKYTKRMVHADPYTGKYEGIILYRYETNGGSICDYYTYEPIRTDL